MTKDEATPTHMLRLDCSLSKHSIEQTPTEHTTPKSKPQPENGVHKPLEHRLSLSHSVGATSSYESYNIADLLGDCLPAFSELLLLLLRYLLSDLPTFRLRIKAIPSHCSVFAVVGMM